MSRKIELTNGIVLDPDEGMCPTLQQYALQKGLGDVRVFVATHPDGRKNYVIVKGQIAVFESQSGEAASAHLDMMWLDRDLR